MIFKKLVIFNFGFYFKLLATEIMKKCEKFTLDMLEKKNLLFVFINVFMGTVDNWAFWNCKGYPQRMRL